jgi:hypothetical protein
MSLSPEDLTVIVEGQFESADWSSMEALAKAGIPLILLSQGTEPDSRPDYLPQSITYDDSKERISKLSEIIDSADTPWTFVLYESERVSPEQLLEAISEVPDSANFLEVAIKIEQNDVHPEHHRFEIRGIKTENAQSKNWTLTGHLWPIVQADDSAEVAPEVVTIARSKPINQTLNWPDLEELEPQSWDTHDQLWLGYYALDQQNTDLAQQLFQQAEPKRLSAQRFQPARLNGLAQVSFLRQRWEQTEEFLKKSLSLNEQQQLPHIIRFNLASKRMHWEQAYQHLYTYLQVLAEGSRINHDVMMPLDQTHKLLAETAYQAGQHERAFAHYQELYRIQQERDLAIEDVTIERLLLYSIELDEKKEAIYYFHQLYDSVLERELSDDEWKEIDRRVQLFAGNEWYDFVVEMYEHIFSKNMKRPESLRRLVAALIKNGQIERAQTLISKHKTVIS